MRQRMPATAEHLFDELGVIPSSFAPQWIMTVFTSSFPLPLTMRVWDVFLAEGWPFVFKVMLALMELASPVLLRMSNFEDALKLLGEDFPLSVPVKDLLETAFGVSLTFREFQELEAESVRELVRDFGLEESELARETGVEPQEWRQQLAWQAEREKVVVMEWRKEMQEYGGGGGGSGGSGGGGGGGGGGGPAGDGGNTEAKIVSQVFSATEVAAAAATLPSTGAATSLPAPTALRRDGMATGTGLPPDAGLTGTGPAVVL